MVSGVQRQSSDLIIFMFSKGLSSTVLRPLCLSLLSSEPCCLLGHLSLARADSSLSFFLFSLILQTSLESLQEPCDMECEMSETSRLLLRVLCGGGGRGRAEWSPHGAEGQQSKREVKSPASGASASVGGDWPGAIDLGPRSFLVVGGGQAGGEEGLGAGLNGKGGRGWKVAGLVEPGSWGGHLEEGALARGLSMFLAPGLEE